MDLGGEALVEALGWDGLEKLKKLVLGFGFGGGGAKVVWGR